MNINTIYQKIGEFVVSFQWIENLFREIGWFILDPERRIWPPTSLRDEDNYSLLNKVQIYFLQAID